MVTQHPEVPNARGCALEGNEGEFMLGTFCPNGKKNNGQVQ